MENNHTSEIIEELRRQSNILTRIEKKQTEATFYLWAIAFITLVSVVVGVIAALAS